MKQDPMTNNTSGSTVFSLFSHLGRKPFNQWNTVQPILLKGDMIAFQGNLFHHGGSFILNSNHFDQHERIVLYAVFHLSDGVKSLVKDDNIDNLPESLFGGTKFRFDINDGTINIVNPRMDRADRRNRYQ